MGIENDDLRSILRNPGSQNGKQIGEAKMASDGYDTLDRADGGRERRGLAAPAKRSIEGMPFYRPRGR